MYEGGTILLITPPLPPWVPLVFSTQLNYVPTPIRLVHRDLNYSYPEAGYFGHDAIVVPVGVCPFALAEA